ncbi:HAD family hydrolase [Pseudoclavibacter sp. 13-3]|uniref:HAD family hydrolase n=1 Tax=Pseudoclavibacter sp. 13-3 TaxID=2901228 RepID=UPI001E65C0D5|nr:HAD-IA family hydrolase [Pseudoclavibacter sp. 13-3]
MTIIQQAQAVLFDLDGVLTPTALVHERAWRRLFETVFAHYGVSPDYTADDYLRYVDGRPRYEGVAAVLASRKLTLPIGTPEDEPGLDTVCSLGNMKNDLFTAVLAADGVQAYPGSVALLEELRAARVPVGVVSSSRNARRVLSAAGLDGNFPVIVDGVHAAAAGLPGKPAPDTYLEGARMLDVDPRGTAVVEDALSGVAAGRAGGFHPVIGVNRGAGRDALLEAGADLVVNDLAELTSAAREENA